MDQHRKSGTKNTIKGKVNEMIGDLRDDPQQERRGRAQQDVGEKQRDYGEALDRARDVDRDRL